MTQEITLRGEGESWHDEELLAEQKGGLAQDAATMEAVLQRNSAELLAGREGFLSAEERDAIDAALSVFRAVTKSPDRLLAFSFATRILQIGEAER